MSDQHRCANEVADMLGVSTQTLRRWAKEGKIEIVRTPGGHNRYNITKYKRDHAGPNMAPGVFRGVRAHELRAK